MARGFLRSFSIINLLLVALMVPRSCSSMLINCDESMICTVQHLASDHLGDLKAHLSGNVSVLHLQDSTLTTFNVSMLHSISPDVALENVHVERFILPFSCTLQRIILQRTRIAAVEISHNTHLLSLKVFDSEIPSLLPSLVNLTSLEVFRLRNVRTPTFSVDVLRNMNRLWLIELNHVHLERLNLSMNLTCCEVLKEVDLSYNKLSAIELAIFNRAPSLMSLRLAYNSITHLVGSLQLPVLKELDLSYNRLKTIDLCQWNISSVINLNVARNQIAHIFDCVDQFEKLGSFSLAHNLLTRVDFAPFAGCPLRSLEFENNQITEIKNLHKMAPDVCIKLTGNPVGKTVDLYDC